MQETIDSLKLGWFSRNSGRRYPIEDTATALSESGVYLPDSFLVDLRISWPESYGPYAFISFASVSASTVAIGIAASQDPNLADTVIPLANALVSRRTANTQVHKLNPMADGVAGFLTFGDTAEEFNLRFATPAQTRLAPTVCQAYKDAGVSSMRVPSAQPLTGDITLVAGNDVTLRNVILETKTGMHICNAIAIGLAAANSHNDPLSKYVGVCNKRPENGDCATGNTDTPAVQTINGLIAACDGTFTIRVENGTIRDGTPKDFGTNSVVLGYDATLEAICDTKNRNPNIAAVINACESPADPPERPCEDLPVIYPMTGEPREAEFWNFYDSLHTATATGCKFLQRVANNGPTFTDGFATYDSCGHTETVDNTLEVTVTVDVPAATASTPIPTNRGGGLVLNFLRDLWLYNSLENKLENTTDSQLRLLIDIDAEAHPGPQQTFTYYYVIRYMKRGVVYKSVRLEDLTSHSVAAFTVNVVITPGTTDIDANLAVVVTKDGVKLAEFNILEQEYGPHYGKHGLASYDEVYTLGNFKLKHN